MQSLKAAKEAADSTIARLTSQLGQRSTGGEAADNWKAAHDDVLRTLEEERHARQREVKFF